VHASFLLEDLTLRNNKVGLRLAFHLKATIQEKFMNVRRCKMDLKLSEQSLKMDFANKEHAIRYEVFTSVTMKKHGSGI
jgi:hypothetical protein